MMQAIPLSIERAGHIVAALGYLDHGTRAAPFSPAVETIPGTTEDLMLLRFDPVAQS
ncbi:hypothetical protein [Roseovarius nanhaiticus]|uniref:hypothetical protein n=1 Tax=Roseovarius nanhaiticus TaxID=573024 RepID=UPI00158A8D16|nr:hypothetical protein [Roseovarius nanhaiticus]